MTWLTQMSFGRTAGDLTDADLRALIMDYSALVDHLTGEVPLPKSNPVPYMWKGYLEAAIIAGMMSCMEWSFTRRYDDKVFWKFSRLADKMTAEKRFTYAAPPWFRDKDVIRSHRSALMAKEPEAYGETWVGAPKRMPILWPVIIDPVDAVYELRVSKADLPAIKSGELVVPPEIGERVVNL